MLSFWLKRWIRCAVSIPTGVHVDLLVVANACSDSTVDVCNDSFSRLLFPARCVVEPCPGLSVARNRAVVESAGEICAFLDDDVLVSPNWLKALVAAYDNYPADVVGGKIDLWWSTNERPDWLDPRLDSYFSCLDYGNETIELLPAQNIVGANFSFRRTVFTEIGPFRSDLGRVGTNLVSNEDTEFCTRARRNHARMFYAPDMQIKHWVAPQRMHVAYLTEVAQGFTVGRIRAKPAFGPRHFFRSFLGNIYLVVWYELSRWYAKLCQNRRKEVTAIVKRASAKAGIVASASRALADWR